MIYIKSYIMIYIVFKANTYTINIMCIKYKYTIHPKINGWINVRDDIAFYIMHWQIINIRQVNWNRNIRKQITQRNV